VSVTATLVSAGSLVKPELSSKRRALAISDIDDDADSGDSVGCVVRNNASHCVIWHCSLGNT